jgi:type IV pilus assembly protein PilE
MEMNSGNSSTQARERGRRIRGFSLIELVVTMLVVSLLAAIAIPGYSNYVRKSRRTEAKTALLDLASLEERYLTTRNTYTTDSATLGYAAGNNWPITIGGAYYRISIPAIGVATVPTSTTSGSPATYTLTATAINDQTKDLSCQTFTVDQAGTQISLDSNGVVSTQTCWR